MKCIYCLNETKVTNSRPRSLNSSVWRRRKCLSCVAQFSTNESPDLNTALLVLGTSLQSSEFSRDSLFLSIYKALEHRKNSVREASEITNTVIGIALRKKYISNGSIKIEVLASITHKVLKRFDPMSASIYKAYHIELL